MEKRMEIASTPESSRPDGDVPNVQNRFYGNGSFLTLAADPRINPCTDDDASAASAECPAFPDLITYFSVCFQSPFVLP